MTFDTWLIGKYNFGKVYEYSNSLDEEISLSEIDKGRFTLHFEGVEGVAIQFYRNGKIHLVLDHYSRPFHVIWIIRSLCFLSCGRDPDLKIERIKILPADASCYQTRQLLRMKGVDLKPSWIDNLPIIAEAMLEDLLYGLRSNEAEAVEELRKEDKPEWWRLLKD